MYDFHQVCRSSKCRRTGFNCECLIIANCKGFFRTQSLQLQSVLLLYMRMRTTYVNTKIKNAMTLRENFGTQLKQVLRCGHRRKVAQMFYAVGCSFTTFGSSCTPGDCHMAIPSLRMAMCLGLPEWAATWSGVMPSLSRGSMSPKTTLQVKQN